MTDEQFQEYLHESVHQLIDLNDKYSEEYKIGDYEHWAYDLETASLTFSNNNVPHVVAEIQAAGSVANNSKSWLWGWANNSLPEHVTDSLVDVKAFGERHNILKLTESYWEAEEEDGWEMAAVANRIIGGKGVYRCPDEKGFLFLILTQIRFVQR